MASIAAPRPISTTPGSSKSPSAGPSHPYTCNSCQVAFRNSDLQRTHMRTDWHRYNLKRRVASLPPISAEVFTEKVLTAQASSTAVAAKASFEKACLACQKTYYSQNAYDNHLRSQRHRQRTTLLAEDGNLTENGSIISSTISLGEPINSTDKQLPPTSHMAPQSADNEAEAEFSQVIDGIQDTRLADEPLSRRPSRPHHSSEEMRAEHPLSPEKSRRSSDQKASGSSIASDSANMHECLFCPTSFPNTDHSLDHMAKTHGLFIPERSYLVDLHGLLGWLWQRVYEPPHECLYCHKTKSTAEAVQGHMKDLGHCKIAFEEEIDLIEVGQFYDFSSTYSDHEDNDLHAGDRRTTEEKLGDDWEDVSDDSSADEDAGVSVDELDNGDVLDAQTIQPKNQAFVFDDDLYLPSGRIAGHRSLAKYYRQNLHNYPTTEERQKLLEDGADESSETVQATRRHHHGASQAGRDRGRQLVTRGQNGIGMIGVTDAKKREVQQIENRDTKRAQRSEKQYQWGLEKRANNQRHFRDPLLQ